MHPRTQELLTYLDEQRAVLKSAFESVPVNLRDQRTAPDRWSSINVVEHLAIVEARVAKLLSERIEEARAIGLSAESSSEPILPTIDLSAVRDRTVRVKAPETAIPTGLDAVAAWTALDEATVKMRGMIAAGDGLALSSVTHPHPRFGPLSVYQWIVFMGAHEARHAAQIREDAQILMKELPH
jgi:hypothetical protein